MRFFAGVSVAAADRSSAAYGVSAVARHAFLFTYVHRGMLFQHSCGTDIFIRSAQTLYVAGTFGGKRISTGFVIRIVTGSEDPPAAKHFEDNFEIYPALFKTGAACGRYKIR